MAPGENEFDTPVLGLGKSGDNVTNFTRWLVVKLLWNDLSMILQDVALDKVPSGI